MSQLASAYVVPVGMFDRLGSLASHRDYSGFWQALDAGTVAIQPTFPYTGYALAVVIAYLEEHDLPLPLNVQNAGAKAISECDLGLVLCAGRGDAPTALTGLDAFVPSEAELRLYYETFTEETWEEAGVAMLEGIHFLRRALVQLQNPGDWLLLFIG